jgi:hypothetical protein
MFSQPGGASTFFDTVVSKKVSLENVGEFHLHFEIIGYFVKIVNFA